MYGVLTWPAYGTWFATRRRGWVDRDGGGDPCTVPEPDRHARVERSWPTVRLDAARRDLVIRDLGRIASLRDFEVHMVVAAADHVHVLLSIDDQRDVPRLVQLVKGSLSRTLTAAAGDEPARSRQGEPLRHHKWWSRQYSFIPVEGRENLDRVTAALADHDAGDTTVWRMIGGMDRRTP